MSEFDVRPVIETAQQAVEPREIAQNYYVVALPHGGIEKIDLHDVLERRGERPARTKGVVRLTTVDELAKFVDEFYDAARTTLWLDEEAEKVVAVLNDATPEGAGWGDHRAHVSLQHTPEWEHWLGLDNRLVSQEAFADHIEEGLPEIVSPDGADLLELAQSFHATTEATFRSARRLSSGEVRFQYDENVQASAGVAGDMAIPDTFELRVAPFIGDEPLAMTARLRYRLHGGKLDIGYRLMRPEQVVRDSLDLMAERLRSRFARVYLGEPR
jgi:uncharacterized protein YfdQ (DUF2303 family)